MTKLTILILYLKVHSFILFCFYHFIVLLKPSFRHCFALKSYINLNLLFIYCPKKQYFICWYSQALYFSRNYLKIMNLIFGVDYIAIIYSFFRGDERGLSRKHIIESVKASLEKLQLEYIDVIIIHRSDDMCPMEGKFRLFS